MKMQEEIREIHLNDRDGEPIFRIGLFEGQDFIDFKVMGTFSVEDAEGNVLIKDVNSDLKWRVKIKQSRPGAERYYLILYESFHKERIQEKYEIAKKFDPNVEVRTLGGDIFLQGRKIDNNTKYILVHGDYPSELAAKKDAKRFQPDFNPKVEKETTREPQGELEVFDAEYEYSAEPEIAVRIVPTDVNTKIHLYNIRSFDEILQKELHRDHIYNGTIEFRIDNQGTLMAISELPLETYLKRVVYSEIGTDLPLEFSKSLAIVSRSEIMARIQHKHLGDPYDFCNWGHCLRYYGDDFEDENIDKAVELTRGQIIMAQERITDAYFNLICGGHTEDASGVWEIDEEPVFHGKYDWKEVPKDFTSLQDEEMVQKWINSRPEAWCNLRGRQVPESLEKYKKYFRWEVSYTRSELEEIIRRKTGEDIGILFDIIPIQRGRSGRLKEIELMGSLKNYRIRGELNIREALSYEYLESSCFVVEKELDDTGTPITFSFIGAGQGHGVGMCKTGGAVMAMEGYDFKQILEHYFENCTIRSIYEMDRKE
ncbi:MAG: SpoIID/LytB domain-containing protein [Calditrichaeota bacterium]|nr:SpoIID/LytB domain-containing protein [Calditrichota bacterium]